MTIEKTKIGEVKQNNTIVEVFEENGVVSVNIKTEDAIVHVNDEVVWSIGNEVEEFKHIPVAMHSFILNNGYDYVKYDEEDKITTVDLYPHGEPISFYIPVNKNKEVIARFDFILPLEDTEEFFRDHYGESAELQNIVPELKAKFEHLKAFIESNGYRLKYSHEMDIWAYGWWDIRFKSSDWDDEKFNEITAEIHKVNQYIKKVENDLEERNFE